MLGHIAQGQRDYSRALSLYEQSAAMLREVGDWHSLAQPLLALAAQVQYRGDLARARQLLEEVLAAMRALGAQHEIVWLLRDQAEVATYQGDYERARVLGEEALALGREGSDLLALVPQLRTRYPSFAVNPALEPSFERQRISDSVATWCELRAERAPSRPL